MINIKNILMPTDLSDYAGYALNYAREFASTYGGQRGREGRADGSLPRVDRQTPRARIRAALGALQPTRCGDGNERRSQPNH